MDYKETDFSFLYCQSYSWKLDIQVKPLESQTHRCRADFIQFFVERYRHEYRYDCGKHIGNRLGVHNSI